MLTAWKGQPPISCSLLKEECVFQQLSVNVSMVFSILWSLHFNSCRANKHPWGFTLCGVLLSLLLILANRPLASLISSTLELVNSGSHWLLSFFSIRRCGYLLPFFCLCDKDHLYETVQPFEPQFWDPNFLLCILYIRTYIYIKCYFMVA